MTPSRLSRSRGAIIDTEDSEDWSDGLSDPMDLGDEPLTIGQDTGFKSASKVLKEVAIPSGNSTLRGPVRRGGRVVATSPSSVSSVGLSNRDQSSGYDTPGTSAVATPAEPAARIGSSFGDLNKATSTTPLATSKVSASVRAQQLRSSKLSLNGSMTKRKKQQDVDVEDHMDISADAQLARTLQDEEYQGGDLKRAKVTKSRKSVVKNFMDESDGLSSLLSDDSVIPSRQIIKSAARISLPTRAARDSAKKSIKEKAITAISDTEESDLTDFDSDEFQTEVSDFEGGGDLSDDEVILALSENPLPPAAAAPRRRRRAYTRAASSTTGQQPVGRVMSARVSNCNSNSVLVMLIT